MLNYLTEPLYSPESIKKMLPLSLQEELFIEKSREDICNVLNGKDPRTLLIVGPCSIHHTTAALSYASKLKSLINTVSDTFVVIMRAYYEKPRTCFGWKGIVNDVSLNGSSDIAQSLYATREFLLELGRMQIPVASEILDPLTAPYLTDLLSWGCIGARTSESQIHRQLASGLPMPIGFKNNPDGNISVAIKGAIAASLSHTFIGVNESGTISTIRTKGNNHSHLVLRGGENKPNYHKEDIQNALKLLEKNHVNPAIIIDCSHDNSLKNHLNQPNVYESVMEQMMEGNTNIKGLILESYLEAGNQPHHDDAAALDPKLSITDPCMAWETTESLILASRDKLHAMGTQPAYSSL